MCDTQVGLDEGLELVDGDGRLHGCHRTLHEAEMQGADHVCVVVDQVQEWAVSDPYLCGSWVLERLWLEAELAEEADQAGESSRPGLRAMLLRSVEQGRAPGSSQLDGLVGRIVDEAARWAVSMPASSR